jgi:hypothetical protein
MGGRGFLDGSNVGKRWKRKINIFIGMYSFFRLLIVFQVVLVILQKSHNMRFTIIHPQLES